MRKPVISSENSPKFDGVPITDTLPYVVRTPNPLKLWGFSGWVWETEICFYINELHHILQNCRKISQHNNDLYEHSSDAG